MSEPLYNPEFGTTFEIAPVPASILGAGGWIDPLRMKSRVYEALRAAAGNARSRGGAHWKDRSSSGLAYEVHAGEYGSRYHAAPKLPGPFRERRIRVSYWSERADGAAPPGAFFVQVRLAARGGGRTVEFPRAADVRRYAADFLRELRRA